MPNINLLKLLKADMDDMERMCILVGGSIFEAHLRSCLLTTDQIKEQWKLGVEQSKIEDFMRMV